jgi:TM2 domain-containing membrane protein YozV
VAEPPASTPPAAAGYTPAPADAAPAPNTTPLDLPPIQLPYEQPAYTPPAAQPSYAPAPTYAQPTQYATPSYGQSAPAATPAYGQTGDYTNYNAQAVQPAPGYAPAPYGQPSYGVQPYSSQAHSKMVAGLLGIFLGGLGFHNFYLGYNQRAIIQIIVTFVTLGFGAIWGFIEGILILVAQPGTPRSFDAAGVPLTQ